MTSILEPFASKKQPNETGTCSVYANVNVIKNIENNENKIFEIEGDTATTTSTARKSTTTTTAAATATATTT